MTEEEVKNNQEVLRIQQNNQGVLRIQQETLNNLKKYNEGRKTQIGDEPLVPKLTLIHHEGTFVEEDPSKYTEIEVVPYFDPDDFDTPEPEWIDVNVEIVNDLDDAVTEVVGDSVNPVMEQQPMQEWLDESDRLNKERGITVGETNKEDLDKFVQGAQEVLNDQYELMKKHNLKSVTTEISPPPICQSCGNFVYLGQLHGPGYCREKIQYEQ